MAGNDIISDVMNHERSLKGGKAGRSLLEIPRNNVLSVSDGN